MPAILILEADIDRTMDEYRKPRNIVRKTKPSDLQFVSATIVAEDDTTYTAHVKTGLFPPRLGSSLIVQINGRNYVPRAYGGNNDAYWSLQLDGLDRAAAEVLNGGPLPVAPKERLTVRYQPLPTLSRLGGPVPVQLTVANAGTQPLTYSWGTGGGANYACRDTQLSFTATFNGLSVPANPEPLPDGFIVSSHTAAPRNVLKRTIDLRDWLQFKAAGAYIVSAVYTIEVQNPNAAGSPRSWHVTYRDHFTVHVGP